MSTPRWFTGSDGRIHLAYELELTNGIAVPTEILGVEVRGNDGEVLLVLEGDDLTAATGGLTASYSEPTTTVAPSSSDVVWMDVVLDSAEDVPASITHALTVGVPPGLPIPEEISYDAAPAEVDQRAPVVLSAPLAGAGWVAVGSCCDGPHRRGLQPVNGALFLSQRFAIDFNRINADGFASVGDLGENESWVFYGDPVYAVADATVVDARNDLPDQVAGAPVGVTIDTADGNFVVLDLGDGRYAFYAHLRPGSVRVEPGDTVRAGEQIGELGNSGSSSGPHLHFHVSDGISALAADGMPYVFESFEVTGETGDYETLGAEITTGQRLTVTGDGAGERQDEYPLGRDVLTFPEE